MASYDGKRDPKPKEQGQRSTDTGRQDVDAFRDGRPRTLGSQIGLRPTDVRQLQRTLGNRATGRVLGLDASGPPANANQEAVAQPIQRRLTPGTRPGTSAGRVSPALPDRRAFVRPRPLDGPTLSRAPAGLVQLGRGKKDKLVVSEPSGFKKTSSLLDILLAPKGGELIQDLPDYQRRIVHMVQTADDGLLDRLAESDFLKVVSDLLSPRVFNYVYTLVEGKGDQGRADNIFRLLLAQEPCILAGFGAARHLNDVLKRAFPSPLTAQFMNSLANQPADPLGLLWVLRLGDGTLEGILQNSTVMHDAFLAQLGRLGDKQKIDIRTGHSPALASLRRILPKPYLARAMQILNPMPMDDVDVSPDPTPVAKGVIEKDEPLYARTGPKSYKSVVILPKKTTVNILRTSGLDPNMFVVHYKGADYYADKGDVQPIDFKHVDRAQAPLFHTLGAEPTSLRDIQQGAIGDCYLLAAMASIVKQDPYFFPSIIQDNDDGTATVKLWDVSFEMVDDPFFSEKHIRVNKSVVASDERGEEYARGALWVQILEKAYTSFIGQQRKRPASYSDIIGGADAYASGTPAFWALLGPRVGYRRQVERTSFPEQGGLDTLTIWSRTEFEKWRLASKTSNYENLHAFTDAFGEDKGKTDEWYKFLTSDGYEKLMGLVRTQKEQRSEVGLQHVEKFLLEHKLSKGVVGDVLAWLERHKLLPGHRGSGRYTPQQTELFTQIQEALGRKRFVTLSSKSQVGKKSTGSGHSADEPESKGLAGRHAYSVLDARPLRTSNPDSPAPGVLNWLQLRNPWGGYGRTYTEDKGRLHAVAEERGDGVFWLELSDLTKRFRGVTIA